RAGDVHAAAERAECRLHHHYRHFRFGDAAWLCEPRAWRSWRVRRGDAGRALAVRQGAGAGRAAALPRSLLCRAICTRALHTGDARALAQCARGPEVAGNQDRARGGSDPQRTRENRRPLTMAIDNESGIAAPDWTSRLRRAWHALVGEGQISPSRSFAPVNANVLLQNLAPV